MPVISSEVADIPALIASVVPLRPIRELWFRGQGCDKRVLAPSLWRRLAKTGGRNGDLSLLSAEEVIETEERLITRFRQRSMPYWPNGYPQSDWEHLFAMQHYGVPTRLLDWSVSLLVAAYFAMEHDPEKCECGGSCRPTVWVLDPRRFNKENRRFDGMDVGVLATNDQKLDAWKPGVAKGIFAPASVALHGTHNNARITAQSGEFTVGGKDITPIEESLEESTSVLWKFTLGADRTVLERQLDLIGVRQASVYPGLDALAKDVAKEEIY